LSAGEVHLPPAQAGDFTEARARGEQQQHNRVQKRRAKFFIRSKRGLAAGSKQARLFILAEKALAARPGLRLGELVGRRFFEPEPLANRGIEHGAKRFQVMRARCGAHPAGQRGAAPAGVARPLGGQLVKGGLDIGGREAGEQFRPELGAPPSQPARIRRLGARRLLLEHGFFVTLDCIAQRPALALGLGHHSGLFELEFFRPRPALSQHFRSEALCDGLVAALYDDTVPPRQAARRRDSPNTSHFAPPRLN